MSTSASTSSCGPRAARARVSGGVLALLAAAALALAAAGCGKVTPGVQLVFGYLWSFSGRGTQPDSLTNPMAAVVLGDGVMIREVWVAEASRGRVSRFGFGGAYLGSFGSPGQFSGPMGLARANDSTVFVLEEGALRVSVVDTSGLTRRTFRVPTLSPLTAMASRGNEVYVAGVTGKGTAGRVVVYTADGEFLRTIGGEPSDSLGTIPMGGLAVADSLVYVSDALNRKVRVFTVNGTLVRSFGKVGTGVGQWAGPGALAVTDDRHLLVADPDNQRVQEYAPDGSFVTQFGRTELGSAASFQVWALAVYSSSRVGEYIYAVDAYAYRVYIVVRRYIRSESKPRLTQPGG
jgi:hypothetical protein